VADPVLERLKDLLVEVDRSGSRRLPTERALTERLNIPRGTLRERLAALEALGIIRSTQGSGTYLADPDAPNSEFVRLYFELALLLKRVGSEDIEVVREMLERECARLAARTRTPEDLAEMRAALDALARAKNAADGLRADYAFHLALARATGNPVLMLIVDGLSAALHHVLASRRAAARRIPGGATATDATHRAVYDAVAAGDPDAAVAAMGKHFSIWSERTRHAPATRKKITPPKRQNGKVRSS